MFAPWCHPNATVNWALSGTQSEHSESKGRKMSDRSVWSSSGACNPERSLSTVWREAESKGAAFYRSSVEVASGEFALRRSQSSEWRLSGAYSPASSRQSSVRGVVGSALSSRLRALRQLRRDEFQSGALRSSGVCVRALQPSLAPHGSASSELRPAYGSASPKQTFSLALQSARQAARAKKVERIAQRLAGIAERHRRQHCDDTV